MKRKRSIFMITAALFGALAGTNAEVPERINFQGRIVDGTNLVNGSVEMVVRLYDAEAGQEVFVETQQVSVVDGLYNIRLGASNAVPGALYDAATNAQLWLELTVDGTTLAPREPFAAVPYALTAHGVVPGGITSAMLQDGVVTSAALATGAVDSPALAANAVQAGNIATGAVQASAIAAGAVGSTAIADGSLASNDFATVSGFALCRILEAFTKTPSADFGISVDFINDSVIAAGSPNVDNTSFGANAGNVGAVWLFDGEGRPLAPLDNPEKTNSAARFGAALAGNGSDRLLVGADGVDEGGFSIAGRVHLFDADGNLIQSITNPLASDVFQFGYAIESLGPDLFAVSAPYGRGSITGAIFVVRASDGAILQTIRDEGTRGENVTPRAFGLLGTNTLVFGNPDSRSLDFYRDGQVHLYEINSGTRMLTITNPAPWFDQQFGASVAVLSTNLFAVGSPVYNTSNFLYSGAVFLYDAAGNLVQTIDPQIENSDFFGWSLDVIDGTNLLIAAQGVDPSGQVYIYDTSGNQLDALIRDEYRSAGGGAYGRATAVSGDNRVLVGNPESSDNVGEAQLYERKSYMPGIHAESVASGSLTPAQFDLPAVDDRYVRRAGDTVEGNLEVEGVFETEGGTEIENLIYVRRFNNQNISIGGAFSFGSSVNVLTFLRGNSNTYSHSFVVSHGSGDYALAIDSNGYVGVGTFYPSNRLDVAGHATVQGNLDAGGNMEAAGDVTASRFRGDDGAAGAPTYGFAGDVNTGIYTPAPNANAISFATSGNEQMRLNASGLHVFDGLGVGGGATITGGLIMASGQIQAQDGSASAPGLRFEGDSNTGVSLAGNNILVFSSAGAEKMRVAGDIGISDDLGLGILDPLTRLHIVDGSTPVIIDRVGSDGSLIRFFRDGTQEGAITVSGNTVSYNNFTGSHPGWTDEPIEPGMLVSMTGENRRLNGNSNSEVLYGIKPTDTYNDPAVLGVYGGLLEPGDPVSLSNPHMVQAAGNSEVWVVDMGRDVRPGDYLIASPVPGHAMVDDRSRAESHIIGKAGSAVDWSTVAPDADDIRRAKISILFGAFARTN